MVAYVKFQQFVEDIAQGVHDFANDTIRVALTNTEPSASLDAVLADLPTEISYTNISGNPTSRDFGAPTTNSQTGGTYTLDYANIMLTATGAVGPFQYVSFYNLDTVALADPLICYFDHGSAVTMANNDTYTISLNASGLFTIT